MQSVPDAFLSRVLRNPLFAAEGMDLERAQTALNAIEEVAAEYEKISAAGSLLTRLWYARYPVARSALPVPFLRKFVESEHLRRAFLAAPSLVSGTELLSSWQKTADAYAKSVKNFSLLHTMLHHIAVREGTALPIQGVFGHYTVWKDVESQLNLFSQNAQQLKTEVGIFSALLRGAQETEEKTVAPVSAFKFVKAGMPAAYKKIHELELAHSLPFRDSTILERHGPLLYTLSNYDGTPVPHIFMTYILRNNRTGIMSLRICALDDFRFRKTGEATDVWHTRSQAQLLGKGIPYWYQPATNLYTMRDQQYLADIATIVDLHRRPAALNVSLVCLQKSSLFDLLLGACLEDHYILLSHLRDNSRRGTYTPELRRLWAHVRTHASIYFMPFNASVWRLPPLSMLGSGLAPLEERPYLKADAVLPTLTEAELELVMRAGRIREETRAAEAGSGLPA